MFIFTMIADVVVDIRERIQKQKWIEAIIGDYSEDLLRICYLYLNDYHLAEDAVQETLLKAYQHSSKFEGRSSEKTWIIRIAINTCKNIIKSKAYRENSTEVAAEDYLLYEEDSVAISEDDSSDFVWEEIERLSPKYKEVIILKYIKDYTNPEISKILSCPETTVRTRLRRAEGTLRDRLSERGMLNG